MIKYYISYQYPNRHFIDFELHIDDIQSAEIEVQLPTWRAGRYQLQYYAKNIQQFEIYDIHGQGVNFQKISKDRWRVFTHQNQSIIIKYNYYAQQLDGGGSWLDEELFYLNFVNCLMYVEDRITEKYSISISLPSAYRLVCGLDMEIEEVEEHSQIVKLKADNFYQAVDAPFLAAKHLQHQSYQVNDCESNFNIWFYGNCEPNWDRLIPDFKAFTQKQVDIFKGFPENQYHFIFIITPFRFYHGVEHFNSTVIVLGEEEMFKQAYFYNDIVGIASHELFHAWNVVKIRPKELLPYDFTQENYFKTGFIIEGITTFYGDWLLARSGVWIQEQYFVELNALLKRHFLNFGRLNMSVFDSSFDLWLDGYAAGIPNRKSSIYVEGAVLCLILDLEIRACTDNQKSMDDVMLLMWERFGKEQVGYGIEDYYKIVNEVAGKDMKEYFDVCVFGKIDLASRINQALHFIGCELVKSYSEQSNEQLFGFTIVVKNGEASVELIEPNSPADKVLSLRDVILEIDNELLVIEDNHRFNELLEEKTMVNLKIRRMGKVKEIRLEADERHYLPIYEIQILPDRTKEQEERFNKWIEYSF
ncbi:MAG: M61 family peptidase [Thermoflexibacter sp.]|nr:M61 family peptidase [Thermoflexibacter sp.]